MALAGSLWLFFFILFLFFLLSYGLIEGFHSFSDAAGVVSAAQCSLSVATDQSSGLKSRVLSLAGCNNKGSSSPPRAPAKQL